MPTNGNRPGEGADASVDVCDNATEPTRQPTPTQAAARSRTELAAVWPPTAEVAHEAGHHRQSPLKAIRAKCIDCSGGSFAEARRCEAISCPLWPFRAGRHPFEKLASNAADSEQGGAFHGGPRVAP